MSRVLPWVLSLVGLVLGYWGFTIVSPEASFTSRLYESAQLLTLESGAVEGPVPIPLDIARWLTPTATVWGLLTLLSRAARERMNALRIRFLFRRHVVILGDDKATASLAEDLARRGDDVLQLHRGTPPGKSGARLIHLPFREHLLENPEVLALSRARMVIASTSDDEDNLALALGLVGRGLQGPEIHARVEQARLADAAARAGAQGEAALSRIRIFNHHSIAARGLLLGLPLSWSSDLHGKSRPVSEVHVVLSDVCPMSEALLLQLARTAHFPGAGPVRVHVLHPSASAFGGGLLERYRGLEQCLDLQLYDTAKSQFSELLKGLLAESGPEAAWTVFPEFSDRPDSMARILELYADLEGQDFQRLRFVLEGPQGRAAQRRDFGAFLPAGSAIHLMPQAETFGGAETLLGGGLDRSSRMIHEAWLAGERERIAEAEGRGDQLIPEEVRSKAAFRAWDQLTEDQRQANRGQADAFWMYLRYAAHASGSSELSEASTELLALLGEGLQPPREENPQIRKKLEIIRAEWPNLSSDLVEWLAEAEHRRWAAHRWLGGWRYGPARDDATRIHPDLVEYDALSERVKAYDRDAVRRLPEVLGTMLSGGPAQTS
jgi:hypothetical protein